VADEIAPVAPADDMVADGKQVKMLLDTLASVLAEMGVLGDEAEASEEPMPEANSAKMDELCKRAEGLKSQIDRLRKIASKERELRAVLNRTAPAVTPVVKADVIDQATSEKRMSIPAMPRVANIRGFSGPNAEERAYRAGQWYRGFIFNDAESRRWCKDHGVESRAQGENSATLGGALIPAEVLDQVIVLVNEFGQFVPNVRTVTMNNETLAIPRRSGGLTTYWVNENATMTDSDAAWDRVNLVAKKLAVSNRMSSEILADSIIDLASYITVEIGRAFAKTIDDCGFNGTGAAGYGGITGLIPALAAVSGAKGIVQSGVATSFETFGIGDFTAAMAALPLYARANAKWFISPAGFAASMQRLALTSGSTTGLSGGNTQNDVQNALGLRFMGYPVVLVNVMDSTLGVDTAKNKILFGDLELGAIYGDRKAVNIRTSTERYAELDQTLMVATTRLDIQVHGVGSNTEAGAYVAMKTKATA
jgi:HK97 family phage major capsid protein